MGPSLPACLLRVSDSKGWKWQHKSDQHWHLVYFYPHRYPCKLWDQLHKYKWAYLNSLFILLLYKEQPKCDAAGCIRHKYTRDKCAMTMPKKRESYKTPITQTMAGHYLFQTNCLHYYSLLIVWMPWAPGVMNTAASRWQYDSPLQTHADPSL